ncbi:Nonribosomal peptide synthetase gloA [Labeo rohita]|uniref:Nonribosomal peptide synthetase gloA n=1 Tax=Labeo rohita TaxID=84645 RepID=A0ABQ8MEK0_LABRO|nr:Nonribosomal peptide synthetase gloA [Labeo rohita]
MVKEAIYELSTGPATAKEIACRPVTAMEAICDFSECPVTAKEAVPELSACPVTAKDAASELSFYQIGLGGHLPVSSKLVDICSAVVVTCSALVLFRSVMVVFSDACSNLVVFNSTCSTPAPCSFCFALASCSAGSILADRSTLCPLHGPGPPSLPPCSASAPSPP